jgi:IPT/TIG domain-containing protein
VAPNAAPGGYHATVMTGFQIGDQPFGFQVAPPAPGRPNITQITTLPGATVSLTGANLSASGSAAGVTVTLNDQPVTVVSGSPNQVLFQVPASTPLGPAQLKLNNGAADAFPIVIEVDGPPSA